MANTKVEVPQMTSAHLSQLDAMLNDGMGYFDEEDDDTLTSEEADIRSLVSGLVRGDLRVVPTEEIVGLRSILKASETPATIRCTRAKIEIAGWLSEGR